MSEEATARAIKLRLDAVCREAHQHGLVVLADERGVRPGVLTAEWCAGDVDLVPQAVESRLEGGAR